MVCVRALIGEPASGKTTIMRSLIKRLGPHRAKSFAYGKVKGYYWEDPDVYLLGQYTGDHFDGTDRLPMDVAPDVREFFEELSDGTIIFEGDRLSADSILSAAPNLAVYTVQPPQEALEHRRQERAAQGRTQDQSWLKGRKTKVQNLCEQYDVHELPWDDPFAAAGVLLESVPTLS